MNLNVWANCFFMYWFWDQSEVLDIWGLQQVRAQMDVFQQNVANQITSFAQKLVDANAVCFSSAAVTHKPPQNYWCVTLTACWIYIWEISRVYSLLWSTVTIQSVCAPFACVRMNCDINADSVILKRNGPCLHLYLLTTCDQMLCFCVWKYKCKILRCAMFRCLCCVYDIFSPVFALVLWGFEILAVCFWCALFICNSNWIMFDGTLSNVLLGHASVVFSVGLLPTN